jgi:hypothetical protein
MSWKKIEWVVFFILMGCLTTIGFYPILIDNALSGLGHNSSPSPERALSVRIG